MFPEIQSINVKISDFEKVKAMPWISVKHNMGFAFNRSTWLNIKNCANQFCIYDDYNWDWSLLHISERCLPEKFHALVSTRPRVFHIGEWLVFCN